jgi:dienelactone hydrolase
VLRRWSKQDLTWLCGVSGKVEKIAGVDVYVATPEQDYPKDKAILFLMDIFGLDLENNKVCANRET